MRHADPGLRVEQLRRDVLDAADARAGIAEFAGGRAYQRDKLRDGPRRYRLID